MSTTAARSLLLGMSIRGYLSPSECDWLDDLAPERWQAFLLHGHEAVFPLDGCPFPHELVSRGGHAFGDAVFSQRHRVSAAGPSQAIRIHTAVINQSEPTPLTLGIYGPDSPGRDETIEEHFFAAVGHFRLASRGLDQLARRVHEAMAGQSPVIAVNRSSGRVLAMNREALDLLSHDESAVIDRQYSDLTGLISKGFANHAVTITNLSDACLSLSLLSWEPIKASRASAPEADRTFDTGTAAPDALDMITQAAWLLAEMHEPELNPRQRALVEDILINTHLLEQHLDRKPAESDLEPSTASVLDPVRQ